MGIQDQENIFTQKFKIRKFYNTKISRSTVSTYLSIYLPVCIYVSIKESYLELESFDVIHGNALDAAATVGGEAGREEEVSVRPKNIVSLEPPPARGVVRCGTAFRTLHHNMALVVLWEERREREERKREEKERRETEKERRERGKERKRGEREEKERREREERKRGEKESREREGRKRGEKEERKRGRDRRGGEIGMGKETVASG